MTAMWHCATCRDIQEIAVWSLGKDLQRAICLEMHLALVMYIRHVRLSPPRLPDQLLVWVNSQIFMIRRGKEDNVVLGALTAGRPKKRLNFDASRVSSLSF